MSTPESFNERSNKLFLELLVESTVRKTLFTCQQQTLAYLMESPASWQEGKMDGKTQVPTDNHAKAIGMILRAVHDKQFDGRLLRDPRCLHIGVQGDNVCVELAPSEENIKQKHIAIWWKCPATASGGRTVEIGFGPNYYDTFDSLMKAIASALDSHA